jgi:Holliday junction DNA helicase RuvA
MIAYIEGNLAYKLPTQVVISAGGLGYEIYISLSTYENIKEVTACKLLTYLHISNDAHTLYGFSTLEEKIWFLHLLSVNGVGPRMAMVILSYLTPLELQEVILGQHAARLQAIKGIGQKVAQRILLELQGKAGQVDSMALSGSEKGQVAIYESALAGLIKLGMQKGIAEKALTTLLKTYPGELTVEMLIKLALKG